MHPHGFAAFAWSLLVEPPCKVKEPRRFAASDVGSRDATPYSGRRGPLIPARDEQPTAWGTYPSEAARLRKATPRRNSLQICVQICSQIRTSKLAVGGMACLSRCPVRSFFFRLCRSVGVIVRQMGCASAANGHGFFRRRKCADVARDGWLVLLGADGGPGCLVARISHEQLLFRHVSEFGGGRQRKRGLHQRLAASRESPPVPQGVECCVSARAFGMR